MSVSSTRTAKWDNIKFLMILFVVTGHILNELKGFSTTARIIYCFIYLFHMPVFIFLSGLLSKRIIREKMYPRILSYGVIYVLMRFSQALVEQRPWNLFYDNTPAWYALAIMAFMFMTILIQDVEPGYMIPAAILFACIAGYIGKMGDHYASMRIATFYPFFLMGFYVQPKELLITLENKLYKVISALLLVLALMFCIWKTDFVYRNYRFLKGAFSYESMNKIVIGNIGIPWFIAKLLYYLIACVLMMSVICLIHAKKTVFTEFGAGTIAVFMWHPMIIKAFFRGKKGVYTLMRLWPTFYTPAAILLGVILTIILSLPIVVQCTRKLITLPVRDSHKKEDEG